jgi:Condensation domain
MRRGYNQLTFSPDSRQPYIRLAIRGQPETLQREITQPPGPSRVFALHRTTQQQGRQHYRPASVLCGPCYLRYSLPRMNQSSIETRPCGSSSTIFLSSFQRWWWELVQVAGAARQPLLVIFVPGQLKISALRRALMEMTRRHESLRTRFVMQPDTVVAVIDPHGEVPLRIEDLSHLQAQERDARAIELIDQHRLMLFELDGGPLFRASLVKLTEQLHVLLLGVHHIIMDSWSALVLRRELLTIYGAYLGGAPPPLPEPQLQLSDYAVWEQQWLRNSRDRDPYCYWESRLREVLPMLLPTDFPRGERSGSREGTHEFELPTTTVRLLRELSRANGMTVQIALLAVYSLLVGHWARRTDVLIGNYMAFRGAPGAAQLIGCFASNRPIHTSFSPEMTVAEYLERVRVAYIEALNFRRVVSFETSWSTRLNNVITNFWRDEQEGVARPPPFQGKPLPVYHDLSLMLIDTPKAIRGSVSYAADLFRPCRMQQFCANFLRLAQTLGENLSLTICESLTALGQYNADRIT